MGLGVAALLHYITHHSLTESFLHYIVYLGVPSKLLLCILLRDVHQTENLKREATCAPMFH